MEVNVKLLPLKVEVDALETTVSSHPETRIRAERPRNRGSISHRDKNYFPKRLYQILGPPSLLVDGCRGLFLAV
jgi:hypothetical protein